MSLLAGAVKAEFTADLSDFMAGVAKAKGEASKMESYGASIGKGIGDAAGFGLKMVAGLAAAGTAAMGVVGGIAISAAKDFEQAKISYTTLLGDTKKANQVLADIQKDAQKTPYNLSTLVKTNQLLISAGVSAGDSRKAVLNLGNAVSATGGSQADLERLAVNLQQIKAVGQASALDIKQFAFAGINIYDLLAKSTGKNVDAIKEMASAGKIGYGEITDALEKASQKGGMFEGALEKQSKSLTGIISNIQDTITMGLANALTNSGLFDKIKGFMEGIMNLLPGIMAGVERFFAVIGNLVTYIGDILSGQDVMAELTELVSYFTGGTAADGAIAQMIKDFVLAMQQLGLWIYENREAVLLFLQSLVIAIGALAVIGGIIALINMLMNPITLVVAALALMYAAYQTNFLGIRDIVNEVVNFVMVIINMLVAEWNANHDLIIAKATASWNIISGFFKVVFGIIALLLTTLVTLMTGNWQQGLVKMQGHANTVWSGIKQFISGIFGNILADVQAFVGRFISYLEGLWAKAQEIARKIKDALSQMSPFHKSSPSLVEYVQMGVADIRSAYKGLEGDIAGMMFKGNLLDIAGVYAQGGGMGGQMGGVTQNITQNISDDIDVQQVNQELAYYMRTQ